MLYKTFLKDWLVNQKIYLKYSTYTNYANIINTQIAPHLGEYDIDILDNDILQQFILMLVLIFSAFRIGSKGHT